MNAGRKSCSLARPEQCVARKKVGKMLRRAIWFANDGNHMCALRFLCVLLDSYVHFGILMCNTGFLCTFCHSYVNFGIPLCNLSYSCVFLCDSQVHVTIPTGRGCCFSCNFPIWHFKPHSKPNSVKSSLRRKRMFFKPPAETTLLGAMRNSNAGERRWSFQFFFLG